MIPTPIAERAAAPNSDSLHEALNAKIPMKNKISNTMMKLTMYRCLLMNLGMTFSLCIADRSLFCLH